MSTAKGMAPVLSHLVVSLGEASVRVDRHRAVASRPAVDGARSRVANRETGYWDRASNGIFIVARRAFCPLSDRTGKHLVGRLRVLPLTTPLDCGRRRPS